jgi:hypothetical protein
MTPSKEVTMEKKRGGGEKWKHVVDDLEKLFKRHHWEKKFDEAIKRVQIGG